MKSSIIFTLLALLTLKLAAAPDFDSLKADAEKLYAEGSFAKAHELYTQARELPASSNDVRWLAFRLADTQWRSQAATQTSDSTKLDAARKELENLVREVELDEDKDRVWVEVQESLGDFHWTRRNEQNWGAAWPYYQ